MFSIGFGKAHRGSTVAVADIGGGGAGVAIFQTSPEGPAKILAFERSVLPPDAREKDASVAGVLAELEKTAVKTLAAYTAKEEKVGTPHVEKVYAVIRAPWTHSETGRATSLFERETKVDTSMIAELAREAMSSTKLNPDALLEASVVRVELNGYPTGKPEGKLAKTMTVYALISECEASIRSGATEVLQKVFACPPPTFRSGIRTLISFLGEKDLLHQDSLIVHITSSGTTLVTMRKGVADEIGFVPEGSWTIAHRIGGDKLPEEVFTLIRMLAEDQCEGDACEAIKNAIAQAEPDLAKIYGEALVKMASVQRLPNAIILLAPRDLSEWLSRFFARIDFAQFTIMMRPFSPTILQLDRDAVAGNQIDAGLDPGLSVASILVNNDHEA